jgi:hypothetical protein
LCCVDGYNTKNNLIKYLNDIRQKLIQNRNSPDSLVLKAEEEGEEFKP